MKIARLVGVVVSALAAFASPHLAAQQHTYPSRPVSLVVPFPAGGSPDVLARIIAEKVSADWGVPVLVENKPGAGSSIGTAHVARAEPDGYTLLVATLSTATAPALLANVSWSPTADFAGVVELLTAPVVALVPTSTPAKTLKEFVAYAKQRPGALNYLMPGVGTSMNLNTVMLERTAGIDLVPIAYKGVPSGMADLLSGRLAFTMAPMSVAAGQVASGKLRALAVASPKRVSDLPDVPTLAEAGLPDAQVVSWYAILAPKKTPRDVIKRINASFVAALADPGVRARLEKAGTVVSDPTTPEQVDALVEKDATQWARIFSEMKIEKQ